MSRKNKNAKKKAKGLWAEFKAFINRGNVVDMAVGVVIGGAFGAIVTSVVNVLLSVCTWGVPGGLNGLITVLPAVNSAQAGLSGIGQSFTDLDAVTTAFIANNAAKCEGMSFYEVQKNIITAAYTKYGGLYVANGAAIINWGAIINAVISFLIIAIVLFIILKVINGIRAKAAAAAAKIKDKIPHKEEAEEETIEEKAE